MMYTRYVYVLCISLLVVMTVSDAFYTSEAYYLYSVYVTYYIYYTYTGRPTPLTASTDHTTTSGPPSPRTGAPTTTGTEAGTGTGEGVGGGGGGGVPLERVTSYLSTTSYISTEVCLYRTCIYVLIHVLYCCICAYIASTFLYILFLFVYSV